MTKGGAVRPRPLLIQLLPVMELPDKLLRPRLILRDIFRENRGTALTGMRLHDGKGKRRKVDRNINIFLLTDWPILASQFTQSAIGFNGAPIKTHRFVIINFTREGQAGNKTRYKPFLPGSAALPAWHIRCSGHREIKDYNDNAKQFKNAKKIAPRRTDCANNKAKTAKGEDGQQEIIRAAAYKRLLFMVK